MLEIIAVVVTFIVLLVLFSALPEDNQKDNSFESTRDGTKYPKQVYVLNYSNRKDACKKRPEGGTVHQSKKHNSYKKYENSTDDEKRIVFERKYYEKFHQTPIQFIEIKLNAGSEIDAIEHLYELKAHGVSQEFRVDTVPFSYYYNVFKKQGFSVPKEEVSLKADYDKTLAKIKVCQRELLHSINGTTFGRFFKEELNYLFKDQAFIEGIRKISQHYSKIEFEENINDMGFLTFKRTSLPNMMFDIGIDMNPYFRRIVRKTAAAGLSENSARITVYYLMRMLDLFEPVLEERSVSGLAKAMKEWL